MKKEQLQNFVEVIDAGSINSAAKNLYVSQPSISRSIHALEEEMGTALILRNNRGVSLTPAGRNVYYYARSILNQFAVLDRIKNANVDTIHSRLSISIDSIFLEDDIILKYYQNINSIEAEIEIKEVTAERVLEDVNKLTSELGILVMNEFQLQVFRKMIDINNIEMEVISSGPLYIHMNKQIETTIADEVGAEELLPLTMVHLPFDFFSNLNMAISVDNIQITNIHKRISMSNYHVIIHMLNHLDTFMLGHKWQIKELGKSNVKSLRLKKCDIVKSLIVIKRKKEILSDAAEIFFNIIRETYQGV